MRTFLNLTAYSPHMTRGVCQMISTLGGRADAEELRQWLAPETMFSRGKPPEDWGFTYAVDVAEHLELIRSESGVWVLDDDLVLDPEGLRGLMLKRVLERAVSAHTDGIDDPTHELTRALSIWMSVSAWKPGMDWTSFQQEQNRYAAGKGDSRPDPRISANARWQVFERWSTYLGFAWRLSDDLLVADPTLALSGVVEEVLPSGRDVSLRDFLRDVAAMIAVIDGGVLHTDLHGASARPAAADEAGGPLSLALLRLEKRGTVTLVEVGDEPPIVLRVGDSVVRRPSRIRRSSPGPGALGA